MIEDDFWKRQEDFQWIHRINWPPVWNGKPGYNVALGIDPAAGINRGGRAKGRPVGKQNSNFRDQNSKPKSAFVGPNFRTGP